jgi:hypothetical protein
LLKSNSFFKKVSSDKNKLNDEYEKLSEINKANSEKIRKSIHQKSVDFNQLKSKRSKHFDFIHNKQR